MRLPGLLDNLVSCAPQDPYLLLGPFRYEEVQRSPWAGLLVDLVSPAEVERVRREARGRMVATTLVDFSDQGNVSKDDYTSRRTSKAKSANIGFKALLESALETKRNVKYL